MSAILKAISAIMAEVGSVTKAGENKFHGYKYTTSADILHKLQPLMAREGLVVFQSETARDMLMDGMVLAVTYDFTLAHKDGETWPTTIVRTGMSSARNTKGGFDDKALNKCHTSAHKYFHLTLFEIPTGDYDDADADEDKAQNGAARKSTRGPHWGKANQARKRGDWETLQDDMMDAGSAISLQRLWDDYTTNVYPTWSPDWRRQGDQLFAARMAEFSSGEDLRETLQDSLDNLEAAEAELPKAQADFAPNARARKQREKAPFSQATAAQVGIFRERAQWLKGATTMPELKTRGANLEHLSEIEKLTPHQIDNLRKVYAEHAAALQGALLDQ